ncbi:response regulator transcription factor [[Hallella] seregens]|uniref:Response regulator transcription factor n=1 Tax=Hallella seregens ATCC 51272 TaxID=1336250 RepID=A0ABV5ZLV5_9BACT|nr:response regulator transcription factor [Hallella seregens]
MNEINVLLVEDEPTLAMIIKDTLEAQGFCIRLAADGEEGLRRMAEQMPDVLVADVMMPHMDGFEMVRRMRQTDTTTPVLFLSARSAVSDVVEGFGLGADDYLKKPFGMQELMVRIRALAMRGQRMAATAPPAPGQEMVIGRYRLNTLTQQLCHDGGVKELSHRETGVLRMLAERSGQVVETRHILQQLWGDDSFFNARSLQVFITKLRHRLAADPGIRILNVRGIGYKLVC